MKTALFLLYFTFVFACNIFANENPNYQFVPNKNQWENDINYRIGIPSGYLYLKNQSLQYLFVDLQRLSDIKHGRIQDSKSRTEEGIAAHSVLINFLESNPNPVILEENPSQDLQNFFLGNDPNFWASNVQSFGKIIYQEMYEGIDFMFSNQKNNLKYEFKLRKQADPAKIRMKYEGASEMRLLENGNLLVKTSLGTWTEQKPYCYQIINDQMVEIPAEFTLENNVLGFHFPKSYNKNYELIIDPELIFSTFSGSTIDNWGNTATYDDEGNLYSGGSFFNPNYPQNSVLTGKVGSFNIIASGISDVCVLKFSPKGQLIFASYFGGSGTEVAHSMFVNRANQIMIMGSTGSLNFPTSTIAFDRSFNGGKFDGNDILEGMTYRNGVDIFVCALRTDGSNIDASTFIGGSDNDGVGQINDPLVKNYGDQFRGEIICDKDNNVYIATTTRSKDFPTTRNAWQKTLKGTQDAVIFKMNPTLSELVWSTYFGGTQNEMAYSLKLNNEGEIFVAGGTDSRDLDTQPNAVNRTYGGNIDGFLAKFQNNGSWSGGTYLGTAAYDQAYFVDIDAEGNVYIFGNTAGNYIIQNAIYRNANGGQFVHKLNPFLNQTLFSTRLGSGRGVPDISPTAFLVSDCGQIYMSGWGGQINNFSPHYIGSQIGRSSTLGLPVTSDALKPVTNGDDFYLMVLEKNATALRYGSFFGGTVTDIGSGNHVDGGTSRFDKKGIIYHAVCACRANNIPTTEGAWSAVNRATNECNIASFKIGILSLKAKFVPRDEKNNIVRSGCVPLKLRFENQSINGLKFKWDLSNFPKTDSKDKDFVVFNTAGIYIAKLTVSDSLACLPDDVAYDTIRVQGGFTSVSADKEICYGEKVQLLATGGNKYVWSPATGLDNPNLQNPIASPETSTRYNLQINTFDGCAYSQSVFVKVAEKLVADFKIDLIQLCDPYPTVKITNLSKGTANYQWDFGNGTTFNGFDPPNFKYTKDGEYTISLKISTDKCSVNAEQKLPMKFDSSTEFYKAIKMPKNPTICQEQGTLLFVTGGHSYQWSPATGLSNPNINNPIASPLQTTVYNVKISNVRGCSVDSTVKVTVLPKIKLDFEAIVRIECGKVAKVQLINKSVSATQYRWEMGNGDTLNTESVQDYSYNKSGKYRILLIGTNLVCTEGKEIILPVENVMPPNVITPNGDGINDTFVISNVRDGWQLQIYDRWGKFVYRSENYQNDWAGDTNTVYFYTLTSPENKACSGWIQVIGK